MKKLRRKTLAHDILTEDEVLTAKDTDQNISVRSLTLLIFAVGWALYGRPQPERESVMPLVTLSIKCFNPLKLLTCVRKNLQKVVCFILFIYSRAFNNNLISNSNCCCNNIFTDVHFTMLLAKNI